MSDFRQDCVCEGVYGEIETEGNRTTEGYNIQCPDGHFTVEGDKGKATGQVKRILSAKGCDANIIDETRRSPDETGTDDEEEVSEE